MKNTPRSFEKKLNGKSSYNWPCTLSRDPESYFESY